MNGNKFQCFTLHLFTICISFPFCWYMLRVYHKLLRKLLFKIIIYTLLLLSNIPSLKLFKNLYSVVEMTMVV